MDCFEVFSKFISGIDASTAGRVTGALICLHCNLQKSRHKCEIFAVADAGRRTTTSTLKNIYRKK